MTFSRPVAARHAKELETDMNPLGWTMMIVSVGSVLTLTVFCLVKVLTLPPVEIEDVRVAPLEIDTRDTKDAD
jgi:hypothetical protein